MEHSSAQRIPIDSDVEITPVVVIERTPEQVRRARFDLRARLASLLVRMHRMAERGWASAAVGLWAFLQAAVVPGPVEAVFVPLGLADPRRVWRFAASATLGSFLGALIAFCIGHFAFGALGLPLLRLLGVGAGDIAHSRAMLADHGWLLVAVSTLTPISLKLSSIAAGAFGVPFALFATIVLVGRTIRYIATAWLLRVAGDRLQRWACAPERRRAP